MAVRMDDIVQQAMAKWPNVPDCYGWLGLDARGDWYMRDDQTQAQGSFSSGKPHSKGSRLSHEKLIEFIQRNYASDARGCWYFQNGPQRVFVELQVTPWVWRLQPDGRVTSHTGQMVNALKCLVDDVGHAYLKTDLGFGLVHTQDVEALAQALEAGRWVAEEVRHLELPARYGYVCSPQAMSKPE